MFGLLHTHRCFEDGINDKVGYLSDESVEVGVRLLDDFENLGQLESIEVSPDGLDQVLKVAHGSFKTLPSLSVVHGLARVLVGLNQGAYRDSLVVQGSSRGVTTDVALKCLLDILQELVFQLVEMCQASPRLVRRDHCLQEHCRLIPDPELIIYKQLCEPVLDKIAPHVLLYND